MFLWQKIRQGFKFFALFCLTLFLFISLGCLSQSDSQVLANRDSPLGGNLDFPGDWSVEYPFIDLLKNSRNWTPDCPEYDEACFPDGKRPEDEGISLLDLDENGWVKSLQAKHDPNLTFANVSTIFLSLNDQPLPETRFYVLYEGEGTLEYTLSVQKNEELSQPGRDVIDITDNSGYAILNISETDPNNTGDYLRNIRIIRADYLDDYEAGETIFAPDFINHVKAYKALRFMDWMLTNDSDEQEWRDRPKPDNQVSYINHYIPGKGRVRGYPIEVMVALANRIQAYPWFNIPHQASDEYIREFAKLVRSELDPNLKVYVEYSNEVWNWGFPQAHYALEAAHERWGKDEKGEYYGDGWMQFHGMKTAQICDSWKQEFGSDRDRVVCVLGVQTGWKSLEESALDCPLYAAEGHQPCWQHGIDALGMTGYFSGYLQKPENVELIHSWLDKGQDYALKQAFRQLEFGDIEGIEGGSEEYKDSIATAIATFKYFKNVAESKNLDIVWYEGGTHFQSSEDDRVDRFLVEVAEHPKIHDLYLKLFNGWKDAGGQLIVMWGGIGENSAWTFKHSLQDTDHPKWRAMIDFINQNPCWWDGCKPSDLSSS
jgi:hypothetical protein